MMRLLALGMALLPLAASASVRGDYLEARTADVWTGPCFANAEVGLAGKEAILAWRVREGSWNGVRLDGLAVIAVAGASATLGDPHADPLPARAVLVVDERATPAQRDALVALARTEGGALVSDVVSVLALPIVAEFARDGHATARVAAGEVVEVATRCFGAHDKHCGNEDVYYPPLARVSGARPAAVTVSAWRGAGLGRTWTQRDKRSAFVATFAVSGPPS